MAHLGQLSFEHGVVVFVVPGDLHDGFASEATRVSQPARDHAGGYVDVASLDGHIVVEPLRHFEGRKLCVQVGEDEQRDERLLNKTQCSCLANRRPSSASSQAGRSVRTTA